MSIDGARAGPLDDSGGVSGYEILIEVLRDPQHHEYAELSQWAGRHFNPDVFDIRATNRILQLAFGVPMP